jgi:hypothetical protein
MTAEERVTMMVKVCMYPDCGEEYESTPVPWEGKAEVISHGLCAHCLQEHYPEKEPT